MGTIECNGEPMVAPMRAAWPACCSSFPNENGEIFFSPFLMNAGKGQRAEINVVIEIAMELAPMKKMNMRERNSVRRPDKVHGSLPLCAIALEHSPARPHDRSRARSLARSL